mmetsp:Transcript_10023/g.29942  ORF Transcript_10023/g.29942 Transcript_10023/m.29942 type:complete len:269 (-) Transcript_10023:163-969(-)
MPDTLFVAWRTFCMSLPRSMMRSLNMRSMSSCVGCLRPSKCTTQGGPPPLCGSMACTPPPSERTKTAPEQAVVPIHSASASAAACRVPHEAPSARSSWYFVEEYRRSAPAAAICPLCDRIKAPSLGFPSSGPSREATSAVFPSRLTARASSSCCDQRSEQLCAQNWRSTASKVSISSSMLGQTSMQRFIKRPLSRRESWSSGTSAVSTMARMRPPKPPASKSRQSCKVLRKSLACGWRAGTHVRRSSLRLSSSTVLASTLIMDFHVSS